MTLILYLCIFMFGAVAASGFNCFLYRLNHDLDWIHGRSVCEVCGEKLQWWEVIPVFSCLLLRGRCSHCHAYFGYSHAIAETTMGALLVVLAYLYSVGRINVIFITLICIVAFGVMAATPKYYN